MSAAGPTRRLLPHQLPNLRDTGGLRTPDDRRLRHRRLLRSAALSQLPGDAARELSSYVADAAGTGHTPTYLDLRTGGEVDEGGEPATLIEQGWTWERVPLSDRVPGDDGPTPEDQLRRYLQHLPAYLETARHVAKCLRHGPVVVACQLGKDRTGLVIALVHHWLGIRRSDIVQDFEFSNQCLRAGHHLLPASWSRTGRSPAIATGRVCAAVLDRVPERAQDPDIPRPAGLPDPPGIAGPAELDVLRSDLLRAVPAPTPN